jgi:hypothetical protein
MGVDFKLILLPVLTAREYTPVFKELFWSPEFASFQDPENVLGIAEPSTENEFLPRENLPHQY